MIDKSLALMSLSLPPSLSPSLFLSHTHTIYITGAGQDKQVTCPNLREKHTHTFSLSLSLALSLSLSLSLIHSLSLTHTHTLCKT